MPSLRYTNKSRNVQYAFTSDVGRKHAKQGGSVRADNLLDYFRKVGASKLRFARFGCNLANCTLQETKSRTSTPIGRTMHVAELNTPSGALKITRSNDDAKATPAYADTKQHVKHQFVRRIACMEGQPWACSQRPRNHATAHDIAFFG